MVIRGRDNIIMQSGSQIQCEAVIRDKPVGRHRLPEEFYPAYAACMGEHMPMKDIVKVVCIGVCALK